MAKTEKKLIANNKKAYHDYFVVCNQFYGFCSHIFPPVSDLSPNSCRHKINCCIFFISIKHTYTDALTEFVNLSKI